MTRIAYLGPAGTFTEQAALTWAADPSCVVAAPTVPAAISTLVQGEVEAAVVPFENSVEGSVPATLAALLEPAAADVRIRAERHVEVQFSLLARPGTTLDDLAGGATLATHPHAAAQTRGWLARTLPAAVLVPESSTARAAQAVAEQRYDAAICAPGAARAYGLIELAGRIADRQGALTRFVLLARDGQLPEATGADRTTLVAWIRDNRPGALLSLLEQFATRGVDLSRLESRPTGEALGSYCFWIDAEAHLHEARLQEALVGLRRTSREVRFLGSYPRADRTSIGVPADAEDEAFARAAAWVESLLGRHLPR